MLESVDELRPLTGGAVLEALPGINVRDYAQALIGLDRWFLHERP